MDEMRVPSTAAGSSEGFGGQDDLAEVRHLQNVLRGITASKKGQATPPGGGLELASLDVATEMELCAGDDEEKNAVPRSHRPVMSTKHPRPGGAGAAISPQDGDDGSHRAPPQPSLADTRPLLSLFIVACFSAYIFSRFSLGLVSTALPVILQNATTVDGFDVKFGPPYIREALLHEAMSSNGVPRSAYSFALVGTDKTSSDFIAPLSPVASGRDEGIVLDLAAANITTFAQARDLARALNEATIATGACKTEAAGSQGFKEGVVAGSGANASSANARLHAKRFQSMQCVPFSESTRAGMRIWIDHSSASCSIDADDGQQDASSSALSLQHVFEQCLLFSLHHPGSGYIIFGSVSTEEGMACSWSDIDVIPWATAGGVDQGKIPSSAFQAQLLQSHEIECHGPTRAGNVSDSGFVHSRQRVVRQSWPLGRDNWGLALRCPTWAVDADGHSLYYYEKLKRWDGDVRLGTVQAVQWCLDSGFAERSDECWEKIKGKMLVDKDSTDTYFDARANKFALSYLREAMEHASNGTFEDFPFADRFEEFDRLSKAVDQVHWEGFRRVWGWGWDLTLVLGEERWETTSTAAYRVGVLPAGTTHEVAHRCYSMHPNGSRNALLWTNTTPNNVRFQGTNITISPAGFSPNVLTIFGDIGLLLVATHTSTRPRAQFTLGAVTLLFLGVTWLFHTAVASRHLDACELRIGSTFSKGSFATFINQTLERVSTGTQAAFVLQAMAWLLSPWVYNTGRLPRNLSGVLFAVGLFYGVLVGVKAGASHASCATPWGVRAFDIYAPVVLAVFASPIALSVYTHKSGDDVMVKKVSKLQLYQSSRALRTAETRKRAIWIQPSRKLAFHSTTGVKIFGVVIKDGPIILTHDFEFEQNRAFAGEPGADSRLIRFVKKLICNFQASI